MDNNKYSDKRFEFGANWARFLKILDEDRIANAEKSLQEFLGLTDMQEMSFLDAGCGSGLFSLAAKRMGARVYSFDYDKQSVNCAKELKKRYFPDDNKWHIEQGDILDEKYVNSLGKHDIVYSWGVLHHTGNMMLAFNRVASTVRDDGGKLFISIYNDQGTTSKFWRTVKHTYVNTPRILRFIFIIPYIAASAIQGLLKHGNPMHNFSNYSQRQRGMSWRYDVYDWLGGYPYEVATADAVTNIFCNKGFTARKVTLCEGKGCNEFVFEKIT